MTSLMLFISFIIHGILLAIIYYLFKQVMELKKNDTKEISQLLEKYLNDIKQENIHLKDMLASKNSQQKQHYKKVTHMHSSKDLQQTKDNDELDENRDIHIHSNNDVIETSLQAQILQLYNQGLTVDHIAKELNCGKTEAELIIKLYEQKNS